MTDEQLLEITKKHQEIGKKTAILMIMEELEKEKDNETLGKVVKIAKSKKFI